MLARADTRPEDGDSCLSIKVHSRASVTTGQVRAFLMAKIDKRLLIVYLCFSLFTPFPPHAFLSLFYFVLKESKPFLLVISVCPVVFLVSVSSFLILSAKCNLNEAVTQSFVCHGIPFFIIS